MNSYFQWLCDSVNCNREHESYYILLGYLHSVRFIIKKANDINRAHDGRKLLYEYLEDCNYQSNESEKNIACIDDSCSILELFIGISKRMAFELAEDDLGDDDFVKYFWEIIDNLNLYDFDDSKFATDCTANTNKIKKIVERFNNRTYSKNGEGGIFPLIKTKNNQRKIELWYQMQEYINEKYALK